ncbi:MAG: ATP-dependent Clp protease ATP-binding subunit, partial [Clostridia bacterium]|nr:ATP-dependent Clp protease ATP-binding subunit [Clostridia bacterium]
TEDKDVILFIDEIHTLVGAGAAEGAVDASNILKPALARGEVQLIGATTPKEFKKSIEKDGALCRRFQQVYVNEPTVEECKTVLYALKDKYEKYHGVCISHQAITAAAEYSHRFISGRYLPDKAIDLIDEAASAKRMSGGETVTERDIAYLTEEMSGVPLEFITDSDCLRVDQAENTLKNGIIGQDAAVSAIIAAVKRRSSRIADGARPAGSMLFYGPCGVGKTECAKKLAFALSGSPKGLISIDMSEYTEPHSVSRLIGAPPGYTGSGEGGVLTEAVRRTPFSTVLFDNAEKAHPDVKSLISRILDKGTLTDSDGITVSFEDVTVIITVSDESLSARAGFYSGKEKGDVTALLPSDITERVDDIIFFAPLGQESLERIGFDHAEKMSLLARRRGEDIFLPSEAVKNAVKECKGSARTLCRDITRLTQEKMWEKQSKKVREYQKST